MSMATSPIPSHEIAQIGALSTRSNIRNKFWLFEMMELGDAAAGGEKISG